MKKIEEEKITGEDIIQWAKKKDSNKRTVEIEVEDGLLIFELEKPGVFKLSELTSKFFGEDGEPAGDVSESKASFMFMVELLGEMTGLGPETILNIAENKDPSIFMELANVASEMMGGITAKVVQSEKN